MFCFTERFGEDYIVWDSLFWLDKAACLFKYPVTCWLPVQPCRFLGHDWYCVCLRFNEEGLADFEHEVADPNVSNAHRIEKDWEHELHVVVEYMLVRPDGSLIDLKCFRDGCLFLYIGTAGCPTDAYITLNTEDILEHCSDDSPTWVEGSSWPTHGTFSCDCALQWVTHEDRRRHQFMQVTKITTPFNGDERSENKFFRAVHGQSCKIEDGGRSVVVVVPPQSHKRKHAQQEPAWVVEERDRLDLSLNFCNRPLDTPMF